MEKGIRFTRIALEIVIKKIDYPRGRAKGYLPAASRFRQLYFSKMLSTEFSLFHPSVSLSTDISPDIQGRVIGNLVACHEELFDKSWD